MTTRTKQTPILESLSKGSRLLIVWGAKSARLISHTGVVTPVSYRLALTVVNEGLVFRTDLGAGEASTVYMMARDGWRRLEGAI